MMGRGSAFSGDAVVGRTSSVDETRSPRRDGGVGEVPLPASSALIFPAGHKVTERSNMDDYHPEVGQRANLMDFFGLI